MTPTLNQNSYRRTPCIVWITVGRDVLSRCACFVYQRDYVIGPTPHAGSAQLDVRDLHRNARFPADANSLRQSLECFVGLVSDVTDVNPTLRACSPRQCD